MSTVRIGTRGSQLALWQANRVADLLRERGHEPELVILKTTGDKRTDVSLASIGGKGLFVKELEEALDRGEIDVAVHSLKDVPSIIPPQFELAGFLERADPRDAWVHPDNRRLHELPAGSVVGTSAPRRRAQLQSLYPQLIIEDIRGNVDTRINKARAGQYSGIILASAGLTRLGRASEITSYFSTDELLPAAGQGIIAIETRGDDARAIAIAQSITHEPSAHAARSERGVLQKFGEQLDCYSCIAVHASEGTIRAFFNGMRASGTTVDEVYEGLCRTGSLTRPGPLSGSENSGGSENRGGLENPPYIGKVFLVGAGPGDPGLLTLKAAELIATADLVALDALVSKEIAAKIPATTEVVYVGKRASAHALPQDQINALLVKEAKNGKRVVRLKGGDPFVFGRGGEEAEELIAAGVPVEIVPGISSAIAGPAYAGIPVTHRSYATSLTLVTGHEADESTGIKWSALAQLDGTIVFMMGLGNLPAIVNNLTKHGCSPDRSVAVISKATTREQRSVTGTLATIEKIVADAQIQTPALIVVGEVVKMHDVINWFETKPLFGRRVVVTRAREQASELKRMLEESGANVLQFPTIEIAPPESFDSLDHVIGGTYDAYVFTSINGVKFFFERLLALGKDARLFAGAKVAAVGDTTAAELRARGIVPDLVPDKFQSIALLPLLADDQTGIRTAVIRAAEGRDELIDELRRRGGHVDLGIAYRTQAADYDLDELRATIDSIDAVTFTSASTVEHFFGKLTPEERKCVADRAKLCSIGPTTTEAIKRYGFSPDVESSNATIAALHDAVVEALLHRSAATSQP